MCTIKNFFTVAIGCTVIGGLNLFSSTDLAGQTTFADGFGVSANVSTASDCPSFCTGDFDFDSDGGELESFAGAISTLYGESRARAYYSSDEFYLPELKAFSSSSGGRGGSASAFGVQGFAYEGTETQNITIGFVLDANVIDSGTFGSESAGASLGVLGLDFFDPDQPIDGPDYFSDFGTWYFENIGTQLGTDSVFVNTPDGMDSGSVTFEVNPGDVFFVGASLSASSRTGLADASNTFTASFSDPVVASQLSIANPTAVPEPTGLALLSMVAIGLIPRRRRNFCS